MHLRRQPATNTASTGTQLQGHRVARPGPHRLRLRTMATSPAAVASKGQAKLLVISSPDSPELSVLAQLPPSVKVVAIGLQPEAFSQLSPAELADVDVLLSCGVGARAGKKETIQALLPLLPSLRWLHSASAGLEHLLCPDITNHPLTLTNAKGVYSNSLAEYALTACNYFAKDFPRLLRAQREGRWDPFDVEELRGRTLGVVGYGDIGQACARLARAFKMRVIGLRRNTTLSAEEQQQGLLDALYPPSQICDLMSSADYIVVSTPYTPDTHHLVSAAAIAAMKPRGVLINVGRGKCVDEEALIAALQSGSIRGAALDVFATEPLPPSSPLWSLPNVLMSPHCADRTADFQFETLGFFIENMNRYLSGEPLKNVCDKVRGY